MTDENKKEDLFGILWHFGIKEDGGKERRKGGEESDGRREKKMEGERVDKEKEKI